MVDSDEELRLDIVEDESIALASALNALGIIDDSEDEDIVDSLSELRDDSDEDDDVLEDVESVDHEDILSWSSSDS